MSRPYFILKSNNYIITFKKCIFYDLARIRIFIHTDHIMTPTLLAVPLWGICCGTRAYPELKVSLALAPSIVHNRTLPPEPALSTTNSPRRAAGTQFTCLHTEILCFYISLNAYSSCLSHKRFIPDKLVHGGYLQTFLYEPKWGPVSGLCPRPPPLHCTAPLMPQ